MSSEFNDYIDKVIGSIGVTGKREKQIREDLISALIEKQESIGESDPYSLLGNPEDVAEEFRENLELKSRGVHYNGVRYPFEYISKTKVFGIPLVHVNTNPFGVAKGVFAAGITSIGVFSFGAISIGVLSFGAIALGILVAMGGVALSGILSMGGAAISYTASLGGLAIAKYISIGGYASADISIGGVCNGIVAVFNQHGTGQYMFKAPANPDEVVVAIKKVKPHMWKWVIELIKNLL